MSGALCYILGMAKGGLSRSQVEHVARLAALPLSSKEVTLYQAQLSQIVGYIGKISKAEGIEQKAEKRLANIARKDERDVRTLSQKDATSGGKNVHNGLFVVPAIFEEA